MRDSLEQTGNPANDRLTRLWNHILRTPYPVTLRRTVQWAVLLMLLVAAWRFYIFVDYLYYGVGSAPIRPPVAEGFLPIAAIVAFKAFIATGQIDAIHPAGLIIFVATIITAWFFRRALCSWICPIGALSEHLGSLGKRIFGRNLTVPRWLDIGLLSLKYLIAVYLIRTFVFMPASDAISFMSIPYYSISDIKMFEMFMNIGAGALAFIGVMVVLSVLIRSFWCRYLCPYGALLGIIGVLSPIVLTKNTESCIKCGRCNASCPSRVNVQDKGRIVASTECTGCATCVSVCPKCETLEFKLFGMLPVEPLAYGVGFVAIFFGIVAIAQLTGHWETSLTIEQYRMLVSAMSGGMGGM